MENASKALIMAGSVLLGILIIALLIFGYRNISNLEQTRENADSNDKMLEYMRNFEQYNRTLYGSELLSLANLLEDYNNTDAREDIGYDRITIIVKINKGIVGSTYFTAGEHNLEDLARSKTEIENYLNKYQKNQKEYNNKSVKYYSQRSNREIAIDFGMDPPSNMLDYDIASEYLEKDRTTAKLLADIQDYTNIRSIYTEFRTGKKFDCKEVRYNDLNGRLNYMYFEEK